MNTNRDPREIAIALMERSTCNVQVGSCVADRYGVFSWGHNHAGPDGLGMHAEVHCLLRANHKRLKHATIYVAAQRKKDGSTVTAKPCKDCVPWVGLCEKVEWRDKDGIWHNNN